MAKSISIDALADTITESLTEYADLATDDMKSAVQKAAKTVKDQIRETAPKDTGKYAKSWTTKKTSESSVAVEYTVYSPTKYQLAHLLEKGHAKRGGGRVAAKPHIADAEQAGIDELNKLIEAALGG
ncbi:MAG: HK97 gp10 family phage protein [Lachnospiraceae bacterium]|nr:HK97 gp10 family phage protein [Lachnospiraceae bacterium]